MDRLCKILEGTEKAVEQMDAAIAKAEAKFPPSQREMLEKTKRSVEHAAEGLCHVITPLRENRELLMALYHKVANWDEECGDHVVGQLEKILKFLNPTELLERLVSELRCDMYASIV